MGSGPWLPLTVARQKKWSLYPGTRDGLLVLVRSTARSCSPTCLALLLIQKKTRYKYTVDICNRIPHEIPPKKEDPRLLSSFSNTWSPSSIFFIGTFQVDSSSRFARYSLKKFRVTCALRNKVCTPFVVQRNAGCTLLNSSMNILSSAFLIGSLL